MPDFDLMETLALVDDAVTRARAAFPDAGPNDDPALLAAAKAWDGDPAHHGLQILLGMVRAATEALQQEVERAGASAPLAAYEKLGDALARLYDFLTGFKYGAFDASDPTTPPWP